MIKPKRLKQGDKAAIVSLSSVFYEEYKDTVTQIAALEKHRPKLPIFYNINIGHAMPIGILPYGIMTELNCEAKTITLLESATVL